MTKPLDVVTIHPAGGSFQSSGEDGLGRQYNQAQEKKSFCFCNFSLCWVKTHLRVKREFLHLIWATAGLNL